MPVVNEVPVNDLAAAERYFSDRLDQINGDRLELQTERKQVETKIVALQDELSGLEAKLRDLERRAEFYQTERSELHRRMATHVDPSRVDGSQAETQVRTTRDRIVEVLATATAPMPMAEVVRLVRENGSPAKEATIREVLLKMHERDEVRRPRRSMYELARRLRAV